MTSQAAIALIGRLSCGANSIGRVLAFQAGCYEFESRAPLSDKLHPARNRGPYQFCLDVFDLTSDQDVDLHSALPD